MKKWKIDRIISVATLVSSALALFLVLKKPQPVAQPQPPAVAAANAQSFQTKVEQFEQAKEPGKPPAEIRLNSEEVGAALMQAASVREGGDQIVGATIVAPHGGEIISELTLAIDSGVGLGRIAGVIHPYPTQAEAIKKIADAYNRTRLTPSRKRLLTRLLAWRR